MTNSKLRFQCRLLVVMAVLAAGPCYAQIIGPIGPLPRIPVFLRGDVNGDRDINVADLALLASSFSRGGPALPCLDAADVNDDGFILLQDSPLGPSGDFGSLHAFLLSLSPLRMGLELPAPFPGRGIDPTADRFGCEDSSGPPPGVDAAGYGFDWEVSAGLVQGSQRQLMFGLATTEAAVRGFSYSCLVNTDVIRVISVAPVIEEDGRGAGVPAVPLFDWVQKPTADPTRDLLLLTVVYVDANGALIPAIPAVGRVANRRVFQIRFAVLANAPLGEVTIVEPFFGGYAGDYGAITGLAPAFAEAGDGGASSQSPFPGNVKSADPLIVGEEPIFLRADSNADGVVNIVDPVYTLRALFVGDVDLPGDPGDANDDGTVELTDSIFTLDFLFKGTVDLPEPYPNCGTDPTTANEILFNLVKFDHCFSL